MKRFLTTISNGDFNIAKHNFKLNIFTATVCFTRRFLNDVMLNVVVENRLM